MKIAHIEKRGTALSFLALLIGVVLALFSGWEMSGETWGYWFFARVFAETGHFIVSDRSPLFTVYLNLFRWMGYPHSVVCEFIVTYFLVLSSLYLLIRPYLGRLLGTLGVLAWLPFLQSSEPSVQALSLALSSLAVIARRQTKTRDSNLTLSYLLLVISCLFRMTNIILLLVFLVFDLGTFFRSNNFRSNRALALKPRSSWAPILGFVLISIYFNQFQSNLPSNTVWFASSKWFPVQGKSILEGSMIQYINWRYIEKKYKTFGMYDFYSTNKELFGDVHNLKDAVIANPAVFVEHISDNVSNLIPTALSATQITRFIPFVGNSVFFSLILFVMVLAGAFMSAYREKPLLIFLTGNTLIVGSTVLALPQTRYMVPLIPIFALSADWYTKQFFKKITLQKPQLVECMKFIGTAGMIYLLSSGYGKSPIAGWYEFFKGTYAFAKGEDRVPLGNYGSPFSMRHSFKQLRDLSTSCKGILSLEHNFIGAFLPVPLSSVYEIWEYPPFGFFGDANSGSLKFDKIDCIFLSGELATASGAGTNIRPRFVYFIEPYIKQMALQNSKVIPVSRFGQAILLH